jgi:hypothetical protein
MLDGLDKFKFLPFAIETTATKTAATSQNQYARHNRRYCNVYAYC